MRYSSDLSNKEHAAMMKIYDQALSPKSTVALMPMMNEVLQKRVVRWRQCAESGQVKDAFDILFTAQPHHSNFTRIDDQKNCSSDVPYLVLGSCFCFFVRITERTNT